MNFGEILSEWYDTKKKLEELEEKITKYKSIISKEMNSKDINHITESGFTVSRRRISKSYLTKESVPSDIWNRYATRCSYDAFFLTREKPEKIKKEKLEKKVRKGSRK
jgi:hypothetical protein